MKLKRPFLLAVSIALLTVTGFAQPRIAVLDFNAGVRVKQSDVDGLSAIFNTYFSPQGYTVVERTRVSLQEHKKIIVINYNHR